MGETCITNTGDRYNIKRRPHNHRPDMTMPVSWSLGLSLLWLTALHCTTPDLDATQMQTYRSMPLLL